MVANDKDLYPVDAKDKWPLFAFIYNYAVSKAELLPPIIFMGVGALTDFRPLTQSAYHLPAGCSSSSGDFLRSTWRILPVWVYSQRGGCHRYYWRGRWPDDYFPDRKTRTRFARGCRGGCLQLHGTGPGNSAPIIRVLTTQKEREIDMPQARPVSKAAVLIFPVATCLITVLFIPASGPLLGMLMFGNLLRESGVTQRLSSTASGPLINIVTIFLGLIVGATMEGTAFLKGSTLAILALGMVAFCLSTAGGVVFAKLLNLVLPSGKKSTPASGRPGFPPCRWRHAWYSHSSPAKPTDASIR